MSNIHGFAWMVQRILCYSVLPFLKKRNKWLVGVFDMNISVLTGLSRFVHVGGRELIADRRLLRSHHGNQLFPGTQHQGFSGPFGRHQRWAGHPHAAPCLLEAAVPFSLSLRQPLIRGRCECVRGQSVWGV